MMSVCVLAMKALELMIAQTLEEAFLPLIKCIVINYRSRGPGLETKGFRPSTGTRGTMAMGYLGKDEM